MSSVDHAEPGRPREVVFAASALLARAGLRVPILLGLIAMWLSPDKSWTQTEDPLFFAVFVEGDSWPGLALAMAMQTKPSTAQGASLLLPCYAAFTLIYAIVGAGVLRGSRHVRWLTNVLGAISVAGWTLVALFIFLTPQPQYSGKGDPPPDKLTEFTAILAIGFPLLTLTIVSLILVNRARAVRYFAEALGKTRQPGADSSPTAASLP